MRIRARANDEGGTILVLSALSIVVLMVFAALTVDLGAAWSERRQDQSAADAAVMAGALLYLNETPPTDPEIVAAVKAFVDKNLPQTPDWAGCSDPDGANSGFLPIEGEGCIRIKLIGGPTTLRVRIPDQILETLFARIIGINTISVSAFAEGTIETRQSLRISPFSLPADPSTEECLGVPPNGTNPDDTGPCAEGSEAGNFGLLDSPWFGRGDPFFTGDVCDDKQQTIETRTEQNIAIGGDHEISVWADVNPLPPLNTDSRNNGRGLDDCDSAETIPVGIPYIMHTEPGSEAGNPAILSGGMIGDGLYGADPGGSPSGFPGRLRQTGGLNEPDDAGDTITFDDGSGPYGLDNVGLWEYLKLEQTNELCNAAKFDSDTVAGTQRTQNMTECLVDGSPKFISKLLQSPRFAVVPSLNYDNLTGDGWFGVVKLVPVYIQTTWYDCWNNRLCLFYPDPDDPSANGPSLPEDYSVFFNPGEGTASPCFYMTQNSPVCGNPEEITLRGVSSYVLDGNSLTPDDWLNTLGNATPFKVYISK